MRKCSSTIVFVPVLLCLLCLGGLTAGARAAVDEDQLAQLQELKKEFFEAKSSSAQRRAAHRMLRLDEPALRQALQFFNEQLDQQEEKYAKRLAEFLPQKYLKHLTTLRDEEIYKIQKTRRLWKRYILKASNRYAFQDNYLVPCAEIKDILLLDVKRVMSRDISSARAVLQLYADYRDKCREKLGLGNDPTVGMKSPTGIDIPPLDRPMTFDDRLAYIEASAVLAYTVGYEGARPILLDNAHVARQIDYEEAEFALFANEVRMLVGSVGYEIDPLVCACTRDHSNDRNDGKASGHASTIPGKERFTDRLKRFGAQGRSEGAGHTKSGRLYIWRLSYGGGHTHPLYALHRNVHGCGRRARFYTSVYYTKDAIRHPCAATENELFMPPGFTGERIASQALRKVYLALQENQFGKARELMPDRRESETDQEVIRRFFKSAIKMEADWALECAAMYVKAGDVYAAQLRLEQAKAEFTGADQYLRKFDSFLNKLNRGRRARELKIGKAYYELPSKSPDDATVQQFIEKHPDSAYAKAGQYYIDHKNDNPKKPKDLFSYFWTEETLLRKYEYHLPE